MLFPCSCVFLFWFADTQNTQSHVVTTGSQLHLGLILKYYYWDINHSMA